MTEVPGAIPGMFSISSDGKTVFSKGNLQYTKSTSTWSFMEHQYSTVETTNQNVGTDYASQDVVSLFGWGTKTNPTSTSMSDSSYSWAEWGENATLISALGSGWRTLTGGSGGEWEYLFNTRTVNNGTGSGHSYTLGQSVNGVLGVVLYPDDYTGAEYTTGSNWSTFEAKGCVFLPAAGFRQGTSVEAVGSDGSYWSSTANGSDNAYDVLFDSGDVYPADDYGRYCGFSVRLVRDAN